MKKKDINELVDGNNALIGNENRSDVNAYTETESNRTTDYNVMVHGQNYGSDFLGRFGFYFYESDDDSVNVEKIEEFIKLLKVLKDDMYSFFKANNINSLMVGFDKYIENVQSQLKGTITESKIAEDKIKKEKDRTGIVDEKDEDEFSDKIKGIADVFSKMNKNDINKLITLLEKNKQYE
jgi:hypothetical protein